MTTLTLPITALYGGILGLLALILSIRITVMRARTKIVLQDGGNQDMVAAVRCFGNFAEYVPLALILIAVLEINGASATTLHALGAALVAGRVIHPFGLDANKPITIGRVVGQSLTWGVVLAASARLLAMVWAG